MLSRAVECCPTSVEVRQKDFLNFSYKCNAVLHTMSYDYVSAVFPSVCNSCLKTLRI